MNQNMICPNTLLGLIQPPWELLGSDPNKGHTVPAHIDIICFLILEKKKQELEYSGNIHFYPCMFSTLLVSVDYINQEKALLSLKQQPQGSNLTAPETSFLGSTTPTQETSLEHWAIQSYLQSISRQYCKILKPLWETLPSSMHAVWKRTSCSNRDEMNRDMLKTGENFQQLAWNCTLYVLPKSSFMYL